MIRAHCFVLTLAMVAGCASNNASSSSDAGEGGSLGMDGSPRTPSDAGPVDADAQSSACTVPQDCIYFPGGPLVSCCINNACVYGQAAESMTCTDPDAQVIAASDYDQSCTADTDCVTVAVGNFCYAGAGNCPNATINKRDYAKYQSDVGKIQASVCQAVSSCGVFSGPCCQSGMCQIGAACIAPVNSGPLDQGCTVAGYCVPGGAACDRGGRPLGYGCGPNWTCCWEEGPDAAPTAYDASFDSKE